MEIFEHICHDCGVREGEIHQLGCDMERCPFCGGQLITCSCQYKQLGLPVDHSKPYAGLPPEIYKKGLPSALESKWIEILEKKGRIPYILYPNICRRCGTPWPKGKIYPDWEWEYYVQKDVQGAVLCDDCFQKIKHLIDQRSGRRPELVPCPFCKDTSEQECLECQNTRTVNVDFIPEQIERYQKHQAMLDRMANLLEQSN